MNSLRSAAILIALSIGSAAIADSKALKGGSTRLAINNSGAIDLVTSSPIQYFNRSVAQGRQIINLRVGQPVLCTDFAPAPVGNRVGLSITDPNNDATAPMYGGISSYDYITNGAQPSLFRISSDASLACCIMLPAANASCVQGSFGGLVLNQLFRDGFEAIATPPGSPATNLVVTRTAPGTIHSGGILSYSFTITNSGGSASGVRVRDWYPKSPAFSASLGSGDWTCTANTVGASCGISGAQTGNVALNNVSLDQNASITIAINRPVASGITNGSTLSVSAAAFSGPSDNESQLIDNQAAATVTVGQFSYTATSSLSFNGTQGISTAAQDVVITANAGNAGTLVVSNCTFGGSHPSDFAFLQNPNFPVGVAIGGTRNLPIVFTGSAVGARSATLTCSTNATSPAQPNFVVNLSGTASAPNSAPTISDIANQPGLEDVVVGPIAFTANDSDNVLTPASFSCNDTTLVAPAGCVFAGSEPNFTLTITPKPNANGVATVQVTVSDGINSASDSFQLTLGAVNDAPDFQLAPNKGYAPGTQGPQSVINFVQNRVPGGGPDENAQTTSVASVTVLGSPTIFAQFGSPSYNATNNALSFSLNGTSGSATVRVRVEDNGANGGPNGDVNFRERDFTITVNPPSSSD